MHDEIDNVVADPARITAWAKAARSGDVFVYATRASLPPSSPGAKLVRKLAENGLVMLTQARLPDRAARNYRATRTSKSWPRAAASKPASDVLVENEAATIDALLPHLMRAARFGLPCPTDAQLARKARVDRAGVPPLLAAMAEMNIILIETMRAPTFRRVTIIETGHRTGIVA